MYKEPDQIINNIKNIQKYIEQDEYKNLKSENSAKYINELGLIFSSFSKEHPFLFRKIVMGDDLSIIYRILDQFKELSPLEKENNIAIYNIALR